MKLSIEEINALARVLEENDLSDIEYSEDGWNIKLSKNKGLVTQVLNEGIAGESKTVIKKETDTGNFHEIKCPLIGHFYLTKTPLDPPYVKIGDKIKKGDVIGILQAMKVSNEIKSDVDGEVVEILVENGQFVDYEYVLMKVKEI